MLASQEGHVDIVTLLVEAGVNKNAQNKVSNSKVTFRCYSFSTHFLTSSARLDGTCDCMSK
jgi:hypothetical protein